MHRSMPEVFFSFLLAENTVKNHEKPLGSLPVDPAALPCFALGSPQLSPGAVGSGLWSSTGCAGSRARSLGEADPLMTRLADPW